MSKIWKFALFVALMPILIGCEHRDILEPSDMHYIRVYINDTIQNINTGLYREDAKHIPYSFPELVKVILCDPESGEMVAYRYLQHEGRDEKGRYFEGHIQCKPGQFKLLARSYGSESTIVSGDENFYQATAYTNPLSIDMASRLPRKSSEDTARVNMPDHLFVKSTDVSIPYGRNLDTLRDVNGEYYVASSIVDSYYIQLKVKGVQYLSSVSSILGGLSGKAMLCDSKRLVEPVEIVFDMDYVDAIADEATIYATFNTFGLETKTKTGSGIMLQFVVVTLDGRAHTTKIDIEEEFYTPNAINNKWLIIDRMIIIPPPEVGTGGGFTPGVNDWKDISADIVI